MTVLEFIRKNSLLVLVVIAGVGAGLVMMDYSGKGSAFSNDFYIKVNGTGYSDAEAFALGENGQSYIQSLYSNCQRKLTERFDTDRNEKFDESEEAAMNAWLSQNPEVGNALQVLNSIYRSWSYGPAKGETNYAINRAIVRAEAETLGLAPSKEQIDAYIQALPAFHNTDGSFDQDFYQRLTGFRNGVASSPTEKAFREVISDMICWECINALMTDGVQYNTKAQGSIIDARFQKVSGKTAWLAKEAVAAPAEPTEEEIIAYHEANKERYKSEERRIISLYTLTPAGDTTPDALLSTADIIMQDLSQANGKGLDAILEGAAANPENAEFTYLLADGSTHVTLPLCALSQLPAELNATVEHNGESTALGQVLFSEVETAPTVAEYEAAGNTEKITSIRQIRGFFPTKDGKLVLARVEAIEAPMVLPYEQARDKALADLRAERAENAMTDTAKKLYDDMTASLAGGDMNAVFDKAAAAGAVVSDFGPVSLLQVSGDLPKGTSTHDLMCTPAGKLTPFVTMPDGVAFTAVTARTIEDSSEYTYRKYGQILPNQNSGLSSDIMTDWLNSAYIRYNVLLAPRATNSNAD